MSADLTSRPPRVVTVPGRGGSEPAHWQSWIERQFARCLRVEQSNWDQPALAPWSAMVSRYVDLAGGPVILVAHSFGCLAAAHALRRAPSSVVAALFVAPASPSRFELDAQLFDGPLSVPTTMVGSRNDPWMSEEETVALASAWGSTFVDLGYAGHINTAAGFGPWPRGKRLVDTLMQRVAQVRRRQSTVHARSAPGDTSRLHSPWRRAGADFA